MRLTDRLADMAVFAQVIESGGFTSAGHRLGVSKAAVSKAVARLEAHLGERLLNRTTRRMHPTEVGLAFYDYCQGVVQQADAAEQHLGQLRAVPRGTLRLTAPLSFGVARVAPLLPALQASHPELQVTLDLDDRVRDLVNDRIDLALRAGPLPDSGLVARRVGRIRASVVAAPAYLDAHGIPLSVADLTRHACLRYDERTTSWAMDDQVAVPIGRGFAINNTLAQLHAARSGAGLALLADYLTDADLSTGRLVRVLPQQRSSTVGLFAVHPYSRHVPAKVSAAIEFFAGHLRD